ncbi:MAG: nucleotide synthetase [Phenylobacterium sp.]
MNNVQAPAPMVVKTKPKKGAAAPKAKALPAVPGNHFVPLPADPPTDFKAKKIVHARLRILRGYRKQLRFSVRTMVVAELSQAEIDAGKEIPEADAAAYAQKVADGEVGLFDAYFLEVKAAKAKPDPTPYDIGVTKQSWVIVELDPATTNWQFGKNNLAITTKEKKPGHNFGLKHVYPSSRGADYPADQRPNPICVGTVKGDQCKVAYFGVARRIKDESQGFNFHTDFLQPARYGSSTIHRMLVIFDPDVGNTGGFPIPP